MAEASEELLRRELERHKAHYRRTHKELLENPNNESLKTLLEMHKQKIAKYRGELRASRSKKAEPRRRRRVK